MLMGKRTRYSNMNLSHIDAIIIQKDYGIVENSLDLIKVTTQKLPFV